MDKEKIADALLNIMPRRQICKRALFLNHGSATKLKSTVE